MLTKLGREILKEEFAKKANSGNQVVPSPGLKVGHVAKKIPGCIWQGTKFVARTPFWLIGKGVQRAAYGGVLGAGLAGKAAVNAIYHGTKPIAGGIKWIARNNTPIGTLAGMGALYNIAQKDIKSIPSSMDRLYHIDWNPYNLGQ